MAGPDAPLADRQAWARLHVNRVDVDGDDYHLTLAVAADISRNEGRWYPGRWLCEIAFRLRKVA